jgi:hypothetical protein
MSSTLVGSVVGAVIDVSAGGSGAQNTGRGYDVALGDLFFNIAPTDKWPYQRATAQFRKDQFDSGQNPGDQSLTGWWKRGQFSFDHGAGVKYYEVSAGETVINRYLDSEGVDPFTAGVVNLHKGWTPGVGWPLANLTNVQVAGTSVAALGDGKVQYGDLGGSATTYSPSAGAVTSMCTGNGDIYCGLADKTITRIGLNETHTAVYTQGFETDTDTWGGNTAFGSADLPTSVVRTTARSFEGAAALRTTWAAPSGGRPQNVVRTVSGLTAGRVYTMVAKVYVPSGSGTVRPVALLNSAGPNVSVFDAWTTVYVNFTSTGDWANIGFENTAPVSGAVLDVDKVFVYDGVVTDYVTSGSVPLDTLYSHNTNIAGLFFAKDRLLMVDTSNVWYQLSPNPSGVWPVTIGSGDKIFTVSGASGWCLTDTPGPILIGNGTRIFAVSVASDGSLPTLSGPIQVGELPVGENVRAMTHHLGFLAIATDKGVRIGVLSDSGRLTYGPRLVDFASAPVNTSIGKDAERVIVAADHVLYDVNLAAQITGLEFAYAKRPTPYAGSETNYGVTVHSTGVLAWSDSAIYEPSAGLATTGYLTTGYHRFATLEPKRFEAVDVRISGTEGTVAVARVDQSGSVIPLFTIDASTSNRADIGLNLNAPVEAVGLKFTLSAGPGGTGPTLLGYQLRALPQPKRQRLIRIPLLIEDQERRRPARANGHAGSGWARLQALEDLESSGTSVLYKDFRSGETASVYVESVEFENTTPPTSARESGLGGVAFLTVRKLA